MLEIAATQRDKDLIQIVDAMDRGRLIVLDDGHMICIFPQCHNDNEVFIPPKMNWSSRLN